MRRVKAVAPVSFTPPARETHQDFHLYVVFTEIEATKVALKTAIDLARDLNARVVLLVAKIVPWPLPLEAPPVSSEFTEHILSEFAGELQADIAARVYLCRDRDSTLRHALEPGSLVMIGGNKRWWTYRTPHLARLLKRDGHEVILAGLTSRPARVASVNANSSLQAL